MSPISTVARPPYSLPAGERATNEDAVNTSAITSTSILSQVRFENDRGRLVGTLLEDDRGLWMRKYVDSRKHQLWKPPAWACDVEHLRQLADVGGVGVRLEDERGRVWKATLAQFRAHGIPIDRGHGPQVALELRHWAVTPTEAP